jgi:hypothetical protein
VAEIKSAIELAMEKTRDLVIDPEEREAMAIREIGDKVKAVLRRFAEEMTDHEDAAKELLKIQADTSLKKSVMVDNLAGEFDVQKNNERLLLLFRTAGIDLQESIRSELETLHKTFRKELEAREAVVREMIMANLAEAGIAGGAIEPNLSAWDEWHEEAGRIGKVFQERMEELKDKVRATSRTV